MTRPAVRPSHLPRLSRRAVLASALATPLLGPARAQGRVRVAVVGGGWGGLSAARHILKAIDGAEVTLIEPNRAFFSCPLSIHYIVGDRRAESLTFPFDGLIREGVRHVAERAQAIDRAARVVVTETQRIPYDFLVLSPGIEYMEEAIPGFAEAKGAIPVGFRAFEQEAVRRALEAHPGGDIVLSVPPVPYRCPIAPYERAALIAQWMDRRGMPGKVILLDLNPAIPIGGPTIQAAFRELYPTRLEHHLGVKITRVDAHAKRIETDKGVLAYGTASLIPPMRAGSIIRQAGLGERWANVTFPNFLSAADDRIYVIGDAVGSTLPKSGHLAYETGVHVADHIADRVAGRTGQDGDGLPSAICFAFFTSEEAMGVKIESRWNDLTREIERRAEIDPRKNRNAAQAAREWSESIWAELVG
ncbi:FAD-dependent oxidoreductase [Elioraea thermophila]|uniref:FAD-dependent oxidoreductase n=1 Tax=Elioraea thermophila TaxID=2185104 RepID=UPI000DF3486E|nr:FAD/NAD(P)-binding oxidoreductase [Elioraea thermophila]